MIDFSKRIYKDEMMDDPNLSSADLSDILKEISLVNLLLGGNRTIKKTLDSVLPKVEGSKISLLDIGCGDGTALRYTARYLKKKGYDASMYGVDINNNAIELAKGASQKFPEIKYFCLDALNSSPEVPRCDIVMSTLTLHHMEDERLQGFVESCQNYSTNIIIINDLERNAWAYYLFKIFGAIFIKTAVARKDGLLSIRKGFKRSELEKLAQQFEDWNHDIYRKWAFRFVWVSERKQQKKL